MSPNGEKATKNPLNVIAAAGLALGGLFGVMGTMVAARKIFNRHSGRSTGLV